MREIKFRAWDEKEKRMIYEETITEIDEDGDEHDYKIILSPYDLMQFTGLKDKNGKDIYEGDIVLESGYNYEVKIGRHYNGKRIAYGVYLKRKNEADNYFDCEDDELEVVGNIYENPKLMENKE